MYNATLDPFNSLTVGVVVDVNDPQQLGRVRARVPAFGDTVYDDVADIPWCNYVSPFGGMVQSNTFTRGEDDEKNSQSITNGPVAYGMFNIPKPGASVLVSCLDGDPSSRIWLGCIHIEQTTHTMPHGRYSYDLDKLDPKEFTQNGQPEGPFSTTEHKIQPLYDNQTQSFGDRGKDNYEWRTRGADHSVTGLPKQIASLYDFISGKSDDEDITFIEKDGHTIISRQGYKLSRLEPDLEFPDTTGKNYDSNVYCWVTPGFHAISMDDSVDNCRIRLRTATGHQIILDSTNERIYISTEQGSNWVEMDSDGSIDIYAKQKISLHGESDVNITSNQAIRMYAAKGIHLTSVEEIRIKAAQDIHTITNQTFRLQATAEIHMESTGNTDLLSHGETRIQAGNGLHLTGGPQVLITGGVIHNNGPSATGANPAGASLAFYTNRVPQHEPWGRTNTVNDFTFDPKYLYDDPNIGRDNKVRGKYWHR